MRRHPDIARAVASRHEIGNHTDTHPYLCFRTPAGIRREIAAAQESIVAAGIAAPSLFRAPYGYPALGLRRALRDAELQPVRWTVIGNDWKLRARAVADRILRKAGADANICLHDGRDVNPNPDIGETIEAVRIILPELLNRGFEFVTVTELLCPTTKSTAG